MKFGTKFLLEKKKRNKTTLHLHEKTWERGYLIFYRQKEKFIRSFYRNDFSNEKKISQQQKILPRCDQTK